MNRDHSWEKKLEHLGSAEERRLLKRLQQEDPDLADAMFAKLVEDNLDQVGLQKAPESLHKKLYAISGKQPAAKQSSKRYSRWWTSGIGAAAVLILAIAIKPWEAGKPSDQEIAQARQQLAITFYYLNKAADITRRETEQSISHGVKAAMDHSPFLDMEAEETSEDDSI